MRRAANLPSDLSIYSFSSTVPLRPAACFISSFRLEREVRLTRALNSTAIVGQENLLRSRCFGCDCWCGCVTSECSDWCRDIGQYINVIQGRFFSPKERV